MKDYIDPDLMAEDCDRESIARDMDLFFGTVFGGVSIVDSQMIVTKTKYSELPFLPLYHKNTDEFKSANEHLRFPAVSAKANKIQH